MKPCARPQFLCPRAQTTSRCDVTVTDLGMPRVCTSCPWDESRRTVLTWHVLVCASGSIPPVFFTTLTKRIHPAVSRLTTTAVAVTSNDVLQALDCCGSPHLCPWPAHLPVELRPSVLRRHSLQQWMRKLKVILTAFPTKKVSLRFVRSAVSVPPLLRSLTDCIPMFRRSVCVSDAAWTFRLRPRRAAMASRSQASAPPECKRAPKPEHALRALGTPTPHECKRAPKLEHAPLSPRAGAPKTRCSAATCARPAVCRTTTAATAASATPRRPRKRPAAPGRPAPAPGRRTAPRAL